MLEFDPHGVSPVTIDFRHSSHAIDAPATAKAAAGQFGIAPAQFALAGASTLRTKKNGAGKTRRR